MDNRVGSQGTTHAPCLALGRWLTQTDFGEIESTAVRFHARTRPLSSQNGGGLACEMLPSAGNLMSRLRQAGDLFGANKQVQLIANWRNTECLPLKSWLFDKEKRARRSLPLIGLSFNKRTI